MVQQAKHLPAGMVHLGNESYETCVAARDALRNGQTVTFVGIGPSMYPVIPTETRCILVPVPESMRLTEGDIVFCGIGLGFLLHRIRGFKRKNRFILIGNNHGQIDGWTTRDKIYGRYVGNL